MKMLENYGGLLVGANETSMILKLLAAILVANCLVVGCSAKPQLVSALQQPGAAASNGHLARSSQQDQPQQQQSKSRQQYFGTYIGRLNGRREHNISGDVFAVDEQTLFIRRFNYDGQAPDAYFWSSVVAPLPSGPDGFIVPDEKGSTKPLERYANKDVVLRLPEGKTLREINWLSVWSRQRQDNLADIFIERSLVLPRPLEIGPLSVGVAGAAPTTNTHGVRSGPITIVDAQTFLVPDLHYDGLAPDAYFWLTRGSQGLSQVNGVRLKDENGSSQALRKYAGETVVISLPDELTVYDFDYFGLWCREFQVNFGQVRIPQQARVPPSPKMLGIKPENKLNCEILYDDLGYEIRWVLDGDDIVMQLVGKIEPDEYMAFGLGKNDSRSEMANADAVVAWVERLTGQVHAVDYFLGGKQQCPGDESPLGAPHSASCPDARLQGGGDSLTLLHGAIVNGYSMVTFKRPQLGIDELYDQHVYSDGQQSVMWAIGQLNARKEVGYHRLRTRGNMFIDFARNPQWNCPIPDLNASMHNQLPVSAAASQLDPTFAAQSGSSQVSSRQRPAPEVQPASMSGTAAAPVDSPQAGWFMPSIVCPQDRTFHAQIGPTGGKRGFESITGRASWGVSWYINGLMIPELVLERGQSYRFIVEGGNDKTSAPRRHPLYLTDSPEGGFHFKTDEERLKERIFAGVALRGDGQFVPTAEGRLCEWRQTNQTLADPDQYQTFSAYQRSLRLQCQPTGGQAAVLKFSPDSSTPDTLYYQCYTHRFMGWRIRVVDSCSAHLAANNINNNNNHKRDLSVSQSTRNEHLTYSRRNSYESPVAASPTSTNPNELLLGPEQLEGPFSGADSLDHTDMLILNNSQLHQRQPYNWSSFDEVLKLSPADLEFLDQQDLQQLLQQNQNPSQLPPQLALQLALINQLADPQFSLHQQTQQQAASKQTVANTTAARLPKTLQSYMRRLASIYYPVQQQLASMLSNQQPNGTSSNTINQQNQPRGQQQPMTSESAPSGSTSSSSSPNSNNNAFSLANLMPKPKIDLSKATLTKKFHKLRFKSGRKLEPTTTNGPPRPANEFNYDIFNNQLAQLEKQQKQLQSFEFGWQHPAESFQHHQQQAMFPFLAHANGGFLMEPVTAEQLNYQSSMLGSNMFAAHQQQKPIYQSPTRPPAKQPARLELSFSFGNRTKPQHQHQHQQQPWPSSQSDEHAIFITRMPQPLGYVPQFPMPTSWQQPTTGAAQVSVQYPNIQPYGGGVLQQDKRRPVISYTDAQQQQQELGGHLSSMPSVALTVHSSDSAASKVGASHQLKDSPSGTSMPPSPVGDSLSGSDSGSMYEFSQHQQRPSDQVKLLMQSESDPSDSDHMLAIERFSKLPSERRPPSIVDPVTGEHILFVDRTQQSSRNSSGRFSSLLPAQTDIMDTEQSVQHQQSSDLQRLNGTASSRHLCSPDATQCGHQNNHLAVTAPPHQAFLIKPASQELDRDKSTTTSSTVASTTEPASTQVSPPSLVTSSQVQGTTDEHQSKFSPTSTMAPLKSNLVEPIKSTLVQNDLTTFQSGSLNGGFINAFNNPRISQFNFDSSPFTPIEINPFYQQQPMMASRLRPPTLIESMYLGQERPEPPVQVASYLSQQLASHSPLLFMPGEKSPASKNPMAFGSAGLPVDDNQAPTVNGNNNVSPLARQSNTNDLIILKPSTLTGDNTYILKPEYMTNPTKNHHHQQLRFSQDTQSFPEDPYSINSIGDPNESSRRLVGGQFDRLSSLSSPPSTSITMDPLQTSHTVNSYDIEHIDSKTKPDPKELKETSTKINTSTIDTSNKGLSQHRQTSVQIPLTGVLEPVLMGATSSNTAEGVRTNPGGPNSNTLLRDNNTDNAILSHVMSLISSNAIATPPLVPVASYSNADYFLPSSDRIYRSIRG